MNIANWDWTQIITVLATVAGTAGTLFGLNKRFPMVAKVVDTVKAEASTLGADVQHFVGSVEQTPAAKLIESEMSKQVTALTEALKQNTLVKTALAGLHAFGLTLDSLSATQLTAIVEHIKTVVPAAWNVSEADIQSAIGLAQKETTALSGSALFAAANTFTAAQKAKDSVATQ